LTQNCETAASAENTPTKRPRFYDFNSDLVPPVIIDSIGAVSVHSLLDYFDPGFISAGDNRFD
jgi:hypothetical protein